MTISTKTRSFLSTLITLAMDACERVISRDNDSATTPIQERCAKAVKASFKREGITSNRWGVANSKTKTASTYRPVGETCHTSCPYLDESLGGQHKGGGGCYALQHHCNTHQKACTSDLFASLASVVGAIVVARMALQTPARLHVSGDFANADDSIDRDYVAAVGEAATLIRLALGRPFATMAYTYTHIPGFDTSIAPVLAAMGVVVLQSDALQVGGALVMDHDAVRLSRAHVKAEHGTTLVACPAQTNEDTTCASCGLCWQAHAKSLTIVFAPHGSKSAVAEQNGAHL